jgi:hypothetical protein
MPAANGSTSGYLTSGNWTTFNNKTSNTGTVTSIATGTGIDGGTITGSGTISVDSTVVLTNNNQTISGDKTFDNPIVANSDIDMESGGDILLSATSGIQVDGDSGVGKFLKSVSTGLEWTTVSSSSGTVTSIATTSPLTGGTITGSGTIGIDQSLISTTGKVTSGTWASNTQLTVSGATDYSFQGEVVNFGTGTVVQGKVYNFNSGGSWSATSSDEESTAKGLLGIATASGSMPTAGMLTRGMYTLAVDPGTIGNQLFLTSTAGLLEDGAPTSSGSVVRIVGTVMDSTNGQIFFHPDNTYITLS